MAKSVLPFYSTSSVCKVSSRTFQSMQSYLLPNLKLLLILDRRKFYLIKLLILKWNILHFYIKAVIVLAKDSFNKTTLKQRKDRNWQMKTLVIWAYHAETSEYGTQECLWVYLEFTNLRLELKAFQVTAINRNLLFRIFFPRVVCNLSFCNFSKKEVIWKAAPMHNGSRFWCL